MSLLTFQSYAVMIIFYAISPMAMSLNCKMSTIGDEYSGRLAISKSGHNCENWSTAVKKLKIYLKDLSFPDGSKEFAKNYCRNPTRQLSGPWCYTRENKLQNSSCDIPFCVKDNCRITGVGEEYRGGIKQSIAGNDCIAWEKIEGSIYHNSSVLCSMNKTNDCHYCRNPGRNRVGPSCFTMNNVLAVEELCDIPFCDDGPVRLFRSENGNVATFHKLINSTSLSIRIRLWDPTDWYAGRVSIIVSALDVPIGIKDIGHWGSALSLTIGNSGSAIMGNEIYDRIATPGILSASQWTNISLSWKQDSDKSLEMYVYVNENKNPTLIANVDTTSTVLEKFQFSYFSIVGTLCFFQFTSETDDCLITTTSQNNYTMWLHLEKFTEQVSVEIYYRIYNYGIIHLKEFPELNDAIKIHLFRNGSLIIADLESGDVFQYFLESNDFWTWNNIKLSITGSSLYLSRLNSEEESVANETIISSLKKIAWIGMSSEAVAYWALNCDPSEQSEPPKPELPECVSSKSDPEYNGSEDITITGNHCIPWIDSRVRKIYPDEENFKRFGGRLASNNFCRNLDSDNNGPFCFEKSIYGGNKEVVKKETCTIRNCSIQDCKHSGIGTDYEGLLTTTRSLRSCSSGYCRNTDHTIGGPWCYTNDTGLHKDFCQIPDCDRADSQMFLLSHDENSYFHVLPHWRKEGLRFWLKNWIPELNAYASIRLMDTSLKNYFKISINEGGNDKIELRLEFNNKEELLFEVTMSHVIRTGGWTGLWLRCGMGLIELGHDKIEVPFLSWSSGPKDINWRIDPKFLSFETEINSWLGVSFNVHECLIGKVSTDKSLIYWPLQSNNENEDTLLEITVQGYGILSIQFYNSPESEFYYSLVIEDGNKVYWGVFNETINNIVVTELELSLINKDSWTKLYIRFNEMFFMLGNNNSTIFKHTIGENDDFLLFYWFGIHSKSGEFSWAANCQPLELNGVPRNGGWGEWSSWICSVSCGGGIGQRTRKCDSPPPNILGNQCIGSAAHEGNCNDFPCGDIPLDISHQIRSSVSSNSVVWQVEKGSSKKLNCNKQYTILLSKHISNVEFIWTKNGFFYEDSVKVNTSSIELWNISSSHSGVWICSATWDYMGTNKSIVMKIIALVVTSETPTITIRQNSHMTLSSNSLPMGRVYTGLSLQWQLNGTIWHDYGVTPMELVTLEHINKVDKSHAGVWMCLVTQEELELFWITAWQRVEVKDPPNFWSHLIEDNATALIFGSMTEELVQKVFFLGIGFLLVFVTVFAIVLNKL